MRSGALETVTFERDAERCETTAELRALLLRCGEQYIDWKGYINRLLDESGLSYAAFAARCGVSKNTLKKWCIEGGAPRCRDTYIKIGFGLKMDRQALDHMLIRYGGYPALYPKDLFDAVCIFALSKQGAAGEYGFAFVQQLYERCLPEELRAGRDEEKTTAVLSRLLAVDTEAEFMRFAAKNPAFFHGRHEKLWQYLDDFARLRAQELSRGEQRCASLHALARQMGYPPDFEKMMSVLKLHGTVPRRERLIAAGLHLGMTLAELNHMLSLAGMERLYAKNKLECAIIYALQRLCLLHPELALSNAMQLMNVTREEHTRKECIALVEEYMAANYQSADEDWGEVKDYVRRVLAHLELGEAEELLSLL